MRHMRTHNTIYAFVFMYFIIICVGMYTTYTDDGVRTGSWKRVESGVSHRGHKKSKIYEYRYAFLCYLGMGTS